MKKKIKTKIHKDCVYPAWDGTYYYGEHVFGKDGDCIICGKSRKNEK